MSKLSDKERQFLLGLKSEDIDYDLLVELFADRCENKNGEITIKSSRIKTYDEFILEKGEYFNKEKILTNAGLFIYNKFLIEKNLQNIVGYVNEPIDSKMLDKIEDKLSKALLNNKINQDIFVEYLNKNQWLAMRFHSVITNSFTMNTLKPNKNIIKERDKLLKENKEKLQQNDVVTAVNIEKKLLEMSKEELKNDPGLNLYASGARGSFQNNYKNMCIMKGPVYNPVTDKFDIVQSNFMEGIRKEEIPVYGNAIITSAFPKAIGTKHSGYFSKQIIAALQAITLDKPGSDCGTKGYLKIVITENLKNDFLYRYIIDGNKLVEITDENINNYLNKEVKLRSRLYCIGKKLCNICAGNIYNKLEIENVGLTAARVSSTLLNLNMKKMHNTTASLYNIKIDDLII